MCIIGNVPEVVPFNHPEGGHLVRGFFVFVLGVSPQAGARTQVEGEVCVCVCVCVCDIGAFVSTEQATNTLSLSPCLYI